MKKSVLIFLSLLVSFSSFSQIDEAEKIKPRKLTYNDFKKLSINDTSTAVIDLFFKKKDKAIFDQMSLLPISAILAIIPPTQIIGIGSALISTPFFINGSFMLIKYRKKKLYKVLIEYKKTKTLPKWVRKKTNKLLDNYEILQINY